MNLNQAPLSWLLLDLPGAPQLAAELARHSGHCVSHELFACTPLHARRAEGPRLLRLAPGSALALRCRANPHDWPGLWLSSRAAPSTLLAHLRQMLVVRYDAGQPGLLAYYQPSTASYFFDGMDAVQLSRWLGPLLRLDWYGGRWPDRAQGGTGWMRLRNPQVPVAALSAQPQLDRPLQERLQQCLLEQQAYRWNQASGYSYPQVWAALCEGVQQGFVDLCMLEQWLSLRSLHPHRVVAPPLRALSPAQRLHALRRLWR